MFGMNFNFHAIFYYKRYLDKFFALMFIVNLILLFQFIFQFLFWVPLEARFHPYSKLNSVILNHIPILILDPTWTQFSSWMLNLSEILKWIPDLILLYTYFNFFFNPHFSFLLNSHFNFIFIISVLKQLALLVYPLNIFYKLIFVQFYSRFSQTSLNISPSTAL